MSEQDECDEADFRKGIVAGVAGGLLGLVMEQFQALWAMSRLRKRG
jgi:hypothetical protein